jgi:hypothetical protein
MAHGRQLLDDVQVQPQALSLRSGRTQARIRYLTTATSESRDFAGILVSVGGWMNNDDVQHAGATRMITSVSLMTSKGSYNSKRGEQGSEASGLHYSEEGTAGAHLG